MRPLDIVQKKRDGHILSPGEIEYFISGYNSGEIPDYQASAWLMAVYFRGMNEAETAAFTQSLVSSGEVLDFSGLGHPVFDKHSTGGVGDKSTLVLLPLAAAAGLHIAKVSGRGLGHTGGTIDKLSCIPGFRTDLTQAEFYAQVKDTGLAVMGQSPQMTPADGKLYALRDVTATVDSIPLIASSVMCKKLAAGARKIVLDVKTGSGAFMQDLSRARKLAEAMVNIGSTLGRDTVAIITAMEQPLGRAVGNHLEVLESIDTLKGKGPADLVELCLHLGTEMLMMDGWQREAAYDRLANCLQDGTALQVLRRWIRCQGGDAAVVDFPEKLGAPRFRKQLLSSFSGVVSGLDARTVGQAAVLLGAGREKKGEEVDLHAGILLHKKVGDLVRKGELLADLYTTNEQKLVPAEGMLLRAYRVSDTPPVAVPLVVERVVP
jgi:pyrimidine-nucleoside phosphorylase